MGGSVSGRAYGLIGKVFILLPLKAGAVAGRAHTKDFVPAGSAAGSEASDEGSWERLEGKGG